MPLGTDEPTWSNIIAEHVRAGCAKIHTSFPAVVVTYNQSAQSATIQPVLRARVDDPLLDRERPELTPPPPIANVPVVWPSGGGPASAWSLHGPLLPGDPVTVLIAERSTDEWRALGVTDNVPLDARRFDVSDAVCFPGGRSFAAGPTGPFGFGATDPVAVVLSGVLVKLGGGVSATHPLAHGDTLIAALTAFATSLTGAADPVVSGAATVLLAALPTTLSVKTFTE
jgi:hypothetical protein